MREIKNAVEKEKDSCEEVPLDNMQTSSNL